MNFSTTAVLSGKSITDDADVARDAIRTHEVVRLSPTQTPDDLRSYYDALVEAIGTPVNIAEDYATGGAPTGERWSEIRYRSDIPDMAAFRHSKNAQPLHTDESYVSTSAGVMLFYCEAAAPAGGETTFISGARLVEFMAESEPELLERLRTIPVRFQKADDFKDRPILQTADDGSVDLNFNFFCLGADPTPEAEKLNQDFHDFLETRLPSELILPVGLAPGEGVTWRDDLVLHGRNAFQAEQTGDRTIWKTGLILPAA